MVELLRCVYYLLGGICVCVTLVLVARGKIRTEKRDCRNCGHIIEIKMQETDGKMRRCGTCGRQCARIVLDDDTEGVDERHIMPEYCREWTRRRRQYRDRR